MLLLILHTLSQNTRYCGYKVQKPYLHQITLYLPHSSMLGLRKLELNKCSLNSPNLFSARGMLGRDFRNQSLPRDVRTSSVREACCVMDVQLSAARAQRAPGWLRLCPRLSGPSHYAPDPAHRSETQLGPKISTSCPRSPCGRVGAPVGAPCEKRGMVLAGAPLRL